MYDCFYCYSNNTKLQSNNKQQNKHILIVVKCLNQVPIILKVLLKLGADVKDSTLLQDCGESNINYSRDLVMIERTGINIKLHRE